MKKYSPMLARLGDKSDLKKKGFSFEEKLDGTRAILYKDGKKIRLINRRGNDITHRYPEFDFSKNIKADSCVLDGEVVVFNKKGISEFNLLQYRDLLEDPEKINRRSKKSPATYIPFDILELNKKSLTKLKQKERFKILKKTIKKNSRIRIVRSSENGKRLFENLTKKGGEGIIAKDPEETYHEGKRLKAWIKVKKSDTIDGIIIGYTQEKRELSTLLLAAYTTLLTNSQTNRHSLRQTQQLIYIGKVGTGFSEKEQDDILKQLEKIKATRPAVKDIPKGTVFVRPKLIAEAKYLEITKDKKMRAPVFVRMRTDKKLKDCVI